MQNPMILKLHIDPDRQGAYFTLPFTMPEGVEALSLAYSYERFHESSEAAGAGRLTGRTEINIVDLGLIDPAGEQVGVSGSDKSAISLSATAATPGYRPTSLVPGEWQIIIGAYHVAPAGVDVTYTLTFTFKHLRLLRGDLHAHTFASDGVQSVSELAWRAKRHGLDFLAITDHNQRISRDALPQIPEFTLIPGVEWTHFAGHANFLGVDRPFDGPFFTNTLAEAQHIFETACARGALVTINHPFEPGMGFTFPFDALPCHVLEVWNGPMRESNLKSIGFWQSLLAAGKKLPICGGSDFHRDSLFQFLGGPTTCVFSLSPDPVDILDAVRRGHAYVIFGPEGPTLEMHAGEAGMGDSVRFVKGMKMSITADRLTRGDVLRVVTATGSTPLAEMSSAGRFDAEIPVEAPGFMRVEILRAFIPGFMKLPALVSNPIYFDAS